MGQREERALQSMSNALALTSLSTAACRAVSIILLSGEEFSEDLVRRVVAGMGPDKDAAAIIENHVFDMWNIATSLRDASRGTTRPR